jgi:hypothetical protein
MIQLPPRPAGSIIEARNEFNCTELFWKNPTGGVSRYFLLLFLLAWMGGWCLGEISAITALLKGSQDSFSKGGGGGFLIFWLVGWTVGGIFAAATIFRLARPSRPESLTLDAVSLFYQPGSEPVQASWRYEKQKGRNPWSMLMPKKPCRVEKRDIGDIRIDRVGERQRLTFDNGAKRIEIGEYLEEPEREWLFAVLKSWKGV